MEREEKDDRIRGADDCHKHYNDRYDSMESIGGKSERTERKRN